MLSKRDRFTVCFTPRSVDSPGAMDPFSEGKNKSLFEPFKGDNPNGES